jgi:hypothetical protein
MRNAAGPNPRMEAIELLMSFNRQIYMACPQVPTLSDRLRSFFSRKRSNALTKDY